VGATDLQGENSLLFSQV